MTDTSKPPVSAPTYAWWVVLCLVGLDYFSSLAYLPSIAVHDDRDLAPLAGLGVVLITLFGALPIYFYVVGRSPHGKGGVGLLESLVRGWTGKLLVLVLLGFVATDFVITRSLSVADASTHILGNPFWARHSQWAKDHREVVRGWFPTSLRGHFFNFWDEQLLLTVLLSILAFALYHFLVRGLGRGFLRLAVGVVVLYLLLTSVVIGSGLAYLHHHPERLDHWWATVQWRLGDGGGGGQALGWWALLAALVGFPPIALGLSGFELSMASAPLVRGRPDDDPVTPRGRIRNARLLLVTAAVLMSAFVIGSMFVVALLVPDAALGSGRGPIQHRALAYLAHRGAIKDAPDALLNPLFGEWFGTVYDASTVLILCLAGASATIGMRDMVPEYLARYGMQLPWAHNVGAIQHLFNLIILVVTIAFQASVGAQQWAYATSVMALLVGASLAAVLDVARRYRGTALRPIVLVPFLLVTGLFLVMGVLLVVQGPSGLGIAAAFVGTVLLTGIVSRYLRCTELRFEGFRFADELCAARWKEICQLEFQVLVPHDPTSLGLAEKDLEIRARHRLGPEVPVIFVEAVLGDPSDFAQRPEMKIERQADFEVVRVCGCTSIAHVLAAIGLAFREVGRPPEIHFAWSDESPMAANFHFLLFGQGNVPWMVHALLRKAEPDPARRPRVIIG